jgi:hypothetical protein
LKKRIVKSGIMTILRVLHEAVPPTGGRSYDE